MVPACSHKVSRVSWYSGSCRAAFNFGYASLTLFGWPSHAIPLSLPVTYAVLTPECKHSGLGSFPFARRYSGNRVFFLFLRVLRCFSSPGSLPCVMYWRMDDSGLHCRVSPFGNPRITGCLLLPVAYRSLSRPSSAPSAKASTSCTYQLNLFPHAKHVWYLHCLALQCRSDTFETLSFLVCQFFIGTPRMSFMTYSYVTTRYF